MNTSALTDCYSFFNLLLESGKYFPVEMASNPDEGETMNDQVVIKDVYQSGDSLQVKYHSRNLQLSVIVPHQAFKTIAGRRVEELLDLKAQGGDVLAETLSLANTTHLKNKEASSLPIGSGSNIDVPALQVIPEAIPPLQEGTDSVDKSVQSISIPNKVSVQREISGVDDRFIFSVSAITSQFKKILTNNFYGVWVKGEVHDAKVSPQGHIFFSLRDQESSLSCVMYAYQAKKLKFKIENGIVFECFGNVSIYEKRGVYQLIVEKLILEGQGEFDLAFKQLKTKLEREGLFDVKHKKAIPLYPRRVGIITSPKGAALIDILKSTLSEYPNMDILIIPSLVQGEHAAADITKKISYLNQAHHLGVDVLLVSRGGGSTEDLWGFNEEILARAIFKSEIPVISAVGHEVDWTICDLVADYRCATPTAAGRFLAQGKKNLQQDFFYLIDTLKKSMRFLFEGIRYRVKDFSPGYLFKMLRSMALLQQRNLGEFKRQLDFSLTNQLATLKNQLQLEVARLRSLSPEGVFKRGYVILKKDDRIVTSIGSLKKDDVIKIISDKSTKDAQIL